MFEESSKNRGIFRTQAGIYDGAFCEYTYRLIIFAIKPSTGLYVGLRKYWNFQNQAKGD